MKNNPWAISEEDISKALLQKLSESAPAGLTLFIIRCTDEAFHKALEEGDPDAILAAKIVVSALHQLEAVDDPDHLPGCIICGHRLERSPHAFLVWASTSRKHQARAAASIICKRCCSGRSNRQLLQWAAAEIKRQDPGMDIKLERGELFKD
jgi:hypothetical protein